MILVKVALTKATPFVSVIVNTLPFHPSPNESYIFSVKKLSVQYAHEPSSFVAFDHDNCDRFIQINIYELTNRNCCNASSSSYYIISIYSSNQLRNPSLSTMSDQPSPNESWKYN